MGSPHRVRFVKQLDNSQYQGLNCNCAAGAMLLDRHTVGAKRTTGARVRQLTGDTSGGTNLRQVRTALYKGWGVTVNLRTPALLGEFDAKLREGHGAILQGSSRATRGTRWQASETFGGNHSWYVSEARGYQSGVPSDYLVFDPLADGRRAGIAKSPFWLPRLYLLRFASWLITSGTTQLGPGKVYAAFSLDTEPHVHPKHGGVRTKPFPDRTRGKAATGKRVNVRSGPATSFPIVETLANRELFTAYQRTTTGQSVSGSRIWYGDHDGLRWVHESGLSHKGGST